VIVGFVGIGGIDDHHCLNFLFISLPENTGVKIQIVIVTLCKRCPLWNVASHFWNATYGSTFSAEVILL